MPDTAEYSFFQDISLFYNVHDTNFPQHLKPLCPEQKANINKTMDNWRVISKGGRVVKVDPANFGQANFSHSAAIANTVVSQVEMMKRDEHLPQCGEGSDAVAPYVWWYAYIGWAPEGQASKPDTTPPWNRSCFPLDSGALAEAGLNGTALPVHSLSYSALHQRFNTEVQVGNSPLFHDLDDG